MVRELIMIASRASSGYRNRQRQAFLLTETECQDSYSDAILRSTRQYNVWVEAVNTIYSGDVELEEMSDTKMGIRMGKIEFVGDGRRRFNGDARPCYAGIQLTDEGKQLLRLS